MSGFAKHWLPFCRKFKVEPRSPIAYFCSSCDPRDSCNHKEWGSMKDMYEQMTNRIDFVVTQGKVPREFKQHIGFLEWNSEITSRNHHPIIKVLIDGRDECAVDIDGNQLPTLVYMAREKRQLYHHNFKAGAMNALVELHGFDYWGGPPYIGSGCFHRREILCGRKFNNEYKENWERTPMGKVEESLSILEETAKALATCTYEQSTQWGKEMGLKYGCPAEDCFTGLSIHCRGWKSIYFNPERKGFLGVAPSTLAQTLVQHRRWGYGTFQVMVKYSPFIYGHGKMKLGHQMAYHTHGLWSANSFPSLLYLAIPSLCLLNGISLFPKVSSWWCIPFAYVFLAKQTYSLIEASLCGDTMNGWWNTQRMWIFKRITSYFYATIDTIFNLLGLSQLAFAITSKVSDVDLSMRYKQEVMEFGVSSSMFTIIATYALLNLLCLILGVKRLVENEAGTVFDPLLLQLILCGMVVLINAPVYEALFLRKDKGNMPKSVIFSSFLFAILACLLPIF